MSDSADICKWQVSPFSQALVSCLICYLCYVLRSKHFVEISPVKLYQNIWTTDRLNLQTHLSKRYYSVIPEHINPDPDDAYHCCVVVQIIPYFLVFLL